MAVFTLKDALRELWKDYEAGETEKCLQRIIQARNVLHIFIEADDVEPEVFQAFEYDLDTLQAFCLKELDRLN